MCVFVHFIRWVIKDLMMNFWGIHNNWLEIFEGETVEKFYDNLLIA
jgi:hypothetical protein